MIKMSDPRHWRASGLAVAAALFCGATTAVMAQSDKVNAVIGEQTRAEQAAKQSQDRIAQLDDETSKALGEYRQMTAEAQSLKTYNDQLDTTVKSQQAELDSITQELADIDATSRGVLPLMQKMLDTLDQFVSLDIPFNAEERRARVDTLKDMMTRADVSISEKYRRIVEAYQIEMEFGRTLEAYEGKVGERTVNFLRVGRVALLYQTLDGGETGYWDVDAKDWKVDNSYRDAITSGIKVAKKQSAPDFVTVPVHAPKEAK
jgi:chromosome segregation ATPase